LERRFATEVACRAALKKRTILDSHLFAASVKNIKVLAGSREAAFDAPGDHLATIGSKVVASGAMESRR
jgi:hypothetical protein